MTITVITPCFNPGKYLLPMLESVAANVDFVAKHVVMDGGSTDGTVGILEAWATTHPWFEFVSERDGGQADACRKALERVETEYFFWLNADDVMCEGALERLSAECGVRSAECGASDAERPAIIYGDYLRIDVEGKVYAKRRQPSFNFWDCLHGYITVQNVAAIFNAPLLRAAGGFDVTRRFVMDYDVILKLAKRGEVRHVRTFCGAFRVHATSKTSTIDDVCRRETDELRTAWGVPTGRFVRRSLHTWAKLRVAFRMLREGVLLERFGRCRHLEVFLFCIFILRICSA